MTHEDAGHYAAKHNEVTQLNKQISAQVKAKAVDGRISCSLAHKIAADLEVEPADVGITIDLLEVRITKCQLGLFGHGSQRKSLTSALSVDQELQRAIKSSLVNDRLPCASAWEIGSKFGLRRKKVAEACEQLKIKISTCRLVAFK
jgi:hypothetical protein